MLKQVFLSGLLCTVSATAQFGPPQPKPTGPWMNQTLTPDQRADLVLAQMTLDEKISLLHGGGWGLIFPNPDAPPTKSAGGAGFVPGIPRLGVPDLQMADAAVGVTRSGMFGRYATALPSGEAEASTWDLELAREYGALIGAELRNQGYNMSLGGGVNLAREPRNGRIFEYKGEDPILAGRLVGAEMKALQAQGVIGDIKHYALNDQEGGRSYVNVNAGKRAIRESDLLAFEIGLKESGAGAVMCSYNLVNGTYACENSYLLSEVLKKDFGFQGFVLSDWGGTHSTAKAAMAGLDMEQPGSDFFGPALKKAVESGEVPTARLDNMVHRILRSEFAAGLFDKPAERQVPDVMHGLEVAQRIAEQSIVLLKNANGQLPLAADKVRTIAVIGSHADVGVLSGGGSAQVDPMGGNPVPQPPNAGIFERVVWHRSSPLKAIRDKAPHADVQFNSGAEPLEAARLAKSSDLAIVFVNQPSSEGSDHPSMSLPNHQDDLVAAVAAANPHTIVVLETGGAVTMPWAGQVSAVMEAWYPGHPRRGGDRQRTVWRCKPLGQAAPDLSEIGVRSSPSAVDGAAARPRRLGDAGVPAWSEDERQEIRRQLRRRPEGRLQVVRRRAQAAVVSVRIRAFVHDISVHGAEGIQGWRFFHGDQYGQTRRSRDRGSLCHAAPGRR